MKLIEGMKRLRIIEKRMVSNNADITRYSSMLSIERPLFETEERQFSTVKELIQSNTDLVKEYLSLKTRIEKTNLETSVLIQNQNYSISELLVIKRKLAALMIATFKSVNDSAASNRLRGTTATADGKTPHVVRFYKEEYRNENLRKWQDLYEEIDSRLEVVNATTELLE